MKTQNVSISSNDKIALISNLSTMLEAGIPILESIDSLLEDSKGGLKKILETLKEDVTQGKRIHFSFAKFPNVFNKVTVNIIKASEESGTLDETLKDLKDIIAKENEFSDKIRSALIYPTIILVVFLVVLVVILTFVIPKISLVFTRLKAELPLPTKILIFASNLILTQTIPVILGLIFITAAMFFLFRKYKRFFVSIFISFPVISKLAIEIDLTRFSRSLYLLLNAGIPITGALELAQEVVIKKQISRAISHSRDAVQSGKKLSSGLKDHKKNIPSIMIKLIEAGEKSGSLEKSMQDISTYFDYQVGKMLVAATVLIEPIILVFTAVLIGGMMISVIGPIYGLIGEVGSAR